MSDDKEYRQEKSAYTAPAETDDYQFYSRMSSTEAKPSQREKAHNAVVLVITAVLILLAAGAAFCVLILRVTLSVHHDESGFSIELVRRRDAAPIMRLEEPVSKGASSDHASSSDIQERYEWTGESLLMAPEDRSDELTFRQLYEICAPSVGVLKSVDGTGHVRYGAVIVMSEDGAVIAGTHVISGASSIYVSLGGEEYEAYILGLDYATDLAVLKIDAEGLPTATFSGEQVHSGDNVAVIGNPVGSVVNITDGMISAVNPAFEYRGYSLEVLQFGMELGDIASGSALVNRSGQIIGIVNPDMASQFAESSGIAFAISMHEAKSIIEELLKNGFVAGRPSSGLTVSELPAAYAAYYEYPTCLYISAVQENSTAELAGLQRGDLILTANGTEVSGVSELYSIINGLMAGDWMTLGIYRDGVFGEVAFQLMEAAAPIRK